MLQRMNELATQSANGTNSTTDRKAIQDEIDQLTTEIDRVSETTKFNEMYLLKGADDGTTTTKTLNAHDAGIAGKFNTDQTKFTLDKQTFADGDKITIAGKEYTIGTATGGTAATLAFKTGNAATNFGTVTGGNYTAFQNEDEMKAALAAGTAIKKGNASTDPAGDDYTYTPAQAGQAPAGTITQDEAYDKIAAELKKASSIGATTAADVTNNNDGTFTITKGTVAIKDALSFNLHVGADADTTNKISVKIDSMSSAGLGIKGIKADTEQDATYAIDAIADAISKVSD